MVQAMILRATFHRCNTICTSRKAWVGEMDYCNYRFELWQCEWFKCFTFRRQPSYTAGDSENTYTCVAVYLNFQREIAVQLRNQIEAAA